MSIERMYGKLVEQYLYRALEKQREEFPAYCMPEKTWDD